MSVESFRLDSGVSSHLPSLPPWPCPQSVSSSTRSAWRARSWTIISQNSELIVEKDSQRVERVEKNWQKVVSKKVYIKGRGSRIKKGNWTISKGKFKVDHHCIKIIGSQISFDIMVKIWHISMFSQLCQYFFILLHLENVKSRWIQMETCFHQIWLPLQVTISFKRFDKSIFILQENSSINLK